MKENQAKSFSELGDVRDMPLHERLRIMREIDEGLIDATPEEMKLLGQARAEKIDAYNFTIAERKGDLARIEALLEPLLAEREFIKNEIKNIYRFLDWNLELEGYQDILGNDYAVTAKSSKKCKARVEADTKAMMRFGDGFVKVSYDWRINEIKKILQSDPSHEINKFCYIEETKKAEILPRQTLERRNRIATRKEKKK